MIFEKLEEGGFKEYWTSFSKIIIKCIIDKSHYRDWQRSFFDKTTTVNLNYKVKCKSKRRGQKIEFIGVSFLVTITIAWRFTTFLSVARWKGNSLIRWIPFFVLSQLGSIRVSLNKMIDKKSIHDIDTMLEAIELVNEEGFLMEFVCQTQGFLDPEK